MDAGDQFRALVLLFGITVLIPSVAVSLEAITMNYNHEMATKLNDLWSFSTTIRILGCILIFTGAQLIAKKRSMSIPAPRLVPNAKSNSLTSLLLFDPCTSIDGLFFVLLGESILFQSFFTLVWFITFCIAINIQIHLLCFKESQAPHNNPANQPILHKQQSVK
jgi:hypothetical protein